MHEGDLSPTPVPEPDLQGAEGRRTLAVTFAGFCAFLGLYATQPLLPMLERLFQTSKAAVSLTLTASTLGVALAAPLVGIVADRLGRKRVIVASASLLALATLLNATATGLPALVFWRFLQGVFTPGVFAVTVAYVQEEWAGGGAGRAMAMYVTGSVIGGFVGRMTTGLIVSHWHWRWSFVVIGLMGAASALVLQAWLPRERRFTGRVQGESPFAGAVAHLRNPRLRAAYAVGFGVLFTLIASFTYVTFHLAGEPFRLGPLALGSLFFTYLVGAVITPYAGHVIDRYGHRTAMVLAMGAGMGGMLLTLAPSLWMVVVGLALCCTGVFVAQAATASYLGVAARQNKALAVGLYVTFYYIGGCVGGELPSYLWRFGGWTACVALVILVQFLTIVITLAGCTTPAREAADLEALPGFE
ncbi:MFS transporter [Geothrix fermentans]|jgi:MFS family permease|uniref:MFS transporter n=1 Tax=Geothrix fermentans TaxID=44676 RepID=UPI00041670EB|nr:MFS transporter [Geothrix fermentans]